jgi:hypothetical protein
MPERLREHVFAVVRKRQGRRGIVGLGHLVWCERNEKKSALSEFDGSLA